MPAEAFQSPGATRRLDGAAASTMRSPVGLARTQAAQQNFANTYAAIPGGCDLSLRRHQVTPAVYRGQPIDSPESLRALNLSPWASQYERTHQARFSPSYNTMSNAQRDQPSGATHNNVATNVWPRDTSSPAPGPRGSAVIQTEIDATAPNASGRVGKLSDPMGEEVDGYPHRSSYKSTFRPPESFTLAGPGTEGEGVVPRWERNHKLPTRAVPPPFCTDMASAVPHFPPSGSGYALNNSFAFEETSLLPAEDPRRQPPVSHYKQTFTEPEERAGMVPKGSHVPVLGDGSVVTGAARTRALNGYLRNGDSLPGVHAANEGGDASLVARDYETSYNSTHSQQSLEAAPRAAQIPVRSVQRPQSVSVDGRANGGSRRRIEHTAFSRSVLPPPTDGLGSEHLKLRLAMGPEAGLHHLSTRPATAGYAAAPQQYHAAQTHRVTPIIPRVGSGIEESQRLAQLRALRLSSPSEYAHELLDAPRYLSTYNLLHGNKRLEQEESEALQGQGVEPYSQGPRGVHAGWGPRQREDLEPDTSNGGMRNAYETAYDRATEDARAHAHLVKARGKSVGAPQATGYTQNTALTQLLDHEDSSVPQAFKLAEQYSLTSHLAHQHPATHVARLPAAVGSSINSTAPLQSAYSREHTVAPVFPSPQYNTVTTLEGRTVVVQASDEDLHPTVRRARAVAEPPLSASKNWGQHDELAKEQIPLRAPA